MITRSFSEVREHARYLEQDSDGQDMRTAATERWKLHSMRDIPQLPEHFTRGAVVVVPSPNIMWLAQSLMADTMSYPTITSVIPQSPDLQKQADEAEKGLALVRAQLDDGGRVSSYVRWHQLVTGWCVMAFNPDLENDAFPCNVETWNPITSFFPISGGPTRPSVIARRYKMAVKDAETRFTNRKGEHSGAGGRLIYDSKGKPVFVKMSDDYPADSSSRFMRGSIKGQLTEMEFIELRDGETISHLALDKGNMNQGEIVWQAKELTRHVSAVVIPGHVSPLPEGRERFQPALWAAEQMTKLINLVRTIRAYKALNAKPDIIAQHDAEDIKARADLGQLPAAVDALRMEMGGQNVVHIDGKAILWTQLSDPDLDALEASFERERSMYINSALQVTTAEVLKQTTIGGLQLALGVRKRQQAPMLSHLDWGWKEMLGDFERYVIELDQDIPLYAKGGERYSKGELRSSMSLVINKKMLSFPHRIEVSTESVTDEEQRAKTQDWAYRASLRLSTHREGITAAGYTNEMEQIEALAEDDACRIAAARFDPLVLPVVMESIRVGGGIDLSLLMQQQAGQQVPTGTPPPTALGANPLHPPLVENVSGGSTPGGNGAGP